MNSWFILLSEHKQGSNDKATCEICINYQCTFHKGYSQLKIIPTVTRTLLSLSPILMTTLNPSKLKTNLTILNIHAFFLAKTLVVVTNQNYNFQPILSLLSSLNEKEHFCTASTFNVLGERKSVQNFTHSGIYIFKYPYTPWLPTTLITLPLISSSWSAHIVWRTPNTTVRPKFVRRTRPMVAISHTIPMSTMCFSFLLPSCGPKTGEFYSKHQESANHWKSDTYTILPVF